MSALRRAPAIGLVTGLLAGAFLLGGCSDERTAVADGSSAPATESPTTGAPLPEQEPTRTATDAPSGEPTKDPAPTPAPTPSAEPEPFGGRRVLAISVDGLNPDALQRLGRDGAPAIWSLLDAGLSTLDARTAVELTKTLPNHVGMVTGRPVEGPGAHGVDWNDNRDGPTIQGAAGGPVESIFTAVHDAGGTTAIFAGKAKFDIFEDSYPDAVDTSVIAPRLAVLAEAITADLREQPRTFTLLHIAEPDEVGHTAGWLSPGYLRSVRETDALVGDLLDVVAADRELREGLVIVLSADHGGQGTNHDDAADPDNYTIPFVVVGDDIPAGDLYELSPGLADPGDGRPSYDGPQPVRNCDVANVAAVALGLDVVPGSACSGALEMPLGPKPG